MINIHDCPVCAHGHARQDPTDQGVVIVTCPQCGQFRMDWQFLSYTIGWQSVPAATQEEIVQFLHTTKAQREALQVALLVLGFDTWRVYVQEGRNRLIRRAARTENSGGKKSKAA